MVGKMDKKKFITFLNFIVVAYNEALENIGLNSNLINSQMSKAFSKKALNLLEKNLQIKIEQNDLNSILNSFEDFIRTFDICKDFKISKLEDDIIKIEFKNSIFNQADKLMVHNKPKNYIPPSPIISMLSSFLENSSGQFCQILKYTFNVNEKSSEYIIKIVKTHEFKNLNT